MLKKIKTFGYQSWPYLIFIAISMIMLPTSLIYQVSPIGDINTMIAMGRSLAHGVVPFVDIFEQRGPYMYVLHMVGALPGNGLHWVYLVELINFYFIYRILIKITSLSKYVTPKSARFYAVGILSLYMFSPTVWYGAAPEEFCLLPITYIVYIIIKNAHISNKSFSIPLNEIFNIGLGFAWIIFIKYSVIGATVGFFLAYGFYLLFQKQFKQFFKTVFMAITGVITMTIPVIILYASTGHLLSAAHAYFIENTGASAYTPKEALIKILNLLLLNTVSNITIITVLVLPFILAIIKFKKISKPGLFILIATFVIQTLMSTMILRYLPTYFSGTVFITIAISAWILPELLLSLKSSPKKVKIFLATMLIIPSIGFAFILDGQLWHFNTLFIHNQVTNLNSDASFKQGQIVKNNGGGSIEVYGDVARSIYQWADSYPTLKYFDQTTIPYKSQPQAGNSQFEYLKNQTADWVQTPVIGFQNKELPTNDIPEFLQYQIAHPRKYESSTKSMAATIDAPIERAKAHSSEYYASIYGSYENKSFIMSYVPKPLLQNYVLVDASQVFEQSHNFKFKNKNVKSITIDLLFTTKKIATKNHLQPISFKTIK